MNLDFHRGEYGFGNPKVPLVGCTHLGKNPLGGLSCANLDLSRT